MNKPQTNGYYRVKIPNCNPEIVAVSFHVNWKRKYRNMVFSRFWNAELETMTDCQWSGPIQPPPELI